jgi:hypothetical protein
MAQFINILKQNAFNNLNTDNWNVDIHGWMDKSFESVFTNAVNGLNTPLTIVEVGTWKGLSTTTMARVCKQLNLSMLISEITRILILCEAFYPDIYNSVEEEVKPDPRRGETSADMATFLERPDQCQRKQTLSNFTAGSTRGGKRYKGRKVRKTRKTRRHK